MQQIKTQKNWRLTRTGLADLFDGAGPQKRSVLVDTGATVNVLQ